MARVSKVRSGSIVTMTVTEHCHEKPKNRKAKTKKTSIGQARINDRHCLKRQVQLVDANFCEKSSAFFTLTYEVDPCSDADAKKDFDCFMRRLKRVLPDVKFSAVFHKGKKTLRKHFHLFLPSCDAVLIRNVWGHGFVDKRELYTQTQFQTVSYMLNGAERKEGKSLFINSRNLDKPTAVTNHDCEFDDVNEIVSAIKGTDLIDYSAGENGLLGRYITIIFHAGDDDNKYIQDICDINDVQNPFDSA